MIPGPSEPYLLSYRLPEEFGRADPARLYTGRMSIEESFRDAKSALRLVELTGRAGDPRVKEGIAFLVFASLAFLRDLAERAPHISLTLLKLPKGFLGLLRRGYYSLTYLGKSCLMRGPYQLFCVSSHPTSSS